MTAKLIYSGILSLDGYTADLDGNFDWSEPDEEVHQFVNDQERSVGAYLLGRKMYEVLQVWETWDVSDEPEVIRDYADIWRAASKVVYSTTLDSVSTGLTTVQRSFDPDFVRALLASSDSDISIGGPTLAAHALHAGLVDEISMYVSPVIVGGGLRFLPEGLKLDLQLVEERRFGNGVVWLRYRVG